MKTLGARIYHCVTCGRVVHVECAAEPPHCCGHSMAETISATTREGHSAREQCGGHTAKLRTES